MYTYYRTFVCQPFIVIVHICMMYGLRVFRVKVHHAGQAESSHCGSSWSACNGPSKWIDRCICWGI